MEKTNDESLYIELTHFARKARRYMRGEALSPDPPSRSHRPCRHQGHHSPILARERILTVLLKHESACLDNSEESACRENYDGDVCREEPDKGIPVKNPAGASAPFKTITGLRQKELIEEMHINASSISEFIGHLEADGCVERNVDPSDKRATLITLTEKGRARARELREQRGKKMQELFSPLSPEEKLELERLLRKLHRREIE